MISFHNEQIEVTLAQDTGEPVSFKRGDREYKVVAIKRVWQDAPFVGPAGGRGRQKAWWDQRGKVFYRVAAEGGQVFDIYRDPRKKAWFLNRSWTQGPEQG